MENRSIMVLAYDRLVDASSDWALLCAPGFSGRSRLVDAALVEVDDDTVVEFHRWTPDLGHAGGAVVAGVIALLRPVSIMVGAAAGGVGEAMLMTWSRAVSRDAAGQLGAVFDRSPFSIVSVQSDGLEFLAGTRIGESAVESTAVSTTVTDEDLDWAILADNARS